MSKDSARRRYRELELSRAWSDGRLPGELRLVDGRRVQVVYRGVWSNSNGPDFKNAMISLDGTLRSGAVEIHLRSSDWYGHGHDTDPAYNDVVLHVVLVDDRRQCLTANGTAIPTLELQGVIGSPGNYHDNRAEKILAALGNRTCLPTLADGQPERVRAVLRSSGWQRLVEKQLRFSQSLQVLTAPEVLYRGLLDALGYSANREPMVRVGEALPLQLLERTASDNDTGDVLAALLGAGGFMPLSPRIVEMCEIGVPEHGLERRFDEVRAAFGLEPVPVTDWSLNRVRPANHPATRLASLAHLIEASGEDGLFGGFMSLALDGGRAWDRWLATARPVIGQARRRQIVTNVLAPFVAAYADQTRDDDLSERVAGLWEQLPGSVSDRVARSARRQIVGAARFPIRLALEEQGLHGIYRNGCSQLRCFECPIAELAIELEPLNAYAIDER